MPNIRGLNILKIFSLVRENKDITLEDLKHELSNDEPYMKPSYALRLIDELASGKKPKLKITDEGTVCIA